MVTNTLDAGHFREFVERLDLIDKFHERHRNNFEWTWTGRGTSGLYYSYWDQVLVKRVDLDYLSAQSFEAYKNSDHKILSESIRLDKAKRRMSGYWKLNSFILDEVDFQD